MKANPKATMTDVDRRNTNPSRIAAMARFRTVSTCEE
jgi:hypothetical protein